MGGRLCSARQTKQGGQVLVPCSHKRRAESSSQRLLAFSCYLSLIVVFWFSRHLVSRHLGKLTVWGVNLSTTQEATGRKSWRLPTPLSSSFFYPAPYHRESCH